MSLKKVLYNKYGIVIKESESDYYKYLVKCSELKYDYVNILKEFTEHCSTRYFKQNKIKEISKELLLTEMSRGKHTPTGKGTAPSYGKGSHGNITSAQIIRSYSDVEPEVCVDTSTGNNIISINDEHKDIDSEDEAAIFNQKLIQQIISKN